MLLTIIGFIVLVIFLAIVIEQEQGTAATAILAILGVAAWFLGGKPIILEVFDFVRTSPGLIVVGVLVYFLLGVVYSFIKWYYFVKEYKKCSASTTPPLARHNTAAIVRWVSYWPFTFWWTLIDKPVRALVDALGYAYDSISRKIYESA